MLDFFKKTFKDFKLETEWIFLFIIFFISLVSFFHIADFWSLTNNNPFNYLTAIATEFFLIASIFAIRFTNWGWIMFVIGLLAQGFGNVYASYTKIDATSFIFIKFKELTEPIFQYIIPNADDLTIMRSLAFITGFFYVVGQSSAFRTYTKVRDKRLSDEADALLEAEMEVEKTENDKLKETIESQRLAIEGFNELQIQHVELTESLKEKSEQLEKINFDFTYQKEKIEELLEEVEHQQSEKGDVLGELMRTRLSKQENEKEFKGRIEQLYDVITNLTKPVLLNEISTPTQNFEIVEDILPNSNLIKNTQQLDLFENTITPIDDTVFENHVKENPTEDNYIKDVTVEEEVLTLNETEIETIQQEIKQNGDLGVNDLTVNVYDTLNTTDGVVGNKQIEYTPTKTAAKKSVLKKER